jgi:hypothetical protein
MIGWLVWQNRKKDRDHAESTTDLLATTTLVRAAEQSAAQEERLMAMRSLGERLASIRPPENEAEPEPTVPPPPEGIEINAGL